MALLTDLTHEEQDRLWWHLIRGLAAVADEIGNLEVCPARIRDSLYGQDVLESFYGLRDDLADLVDTDLGQTPPARWLLDETEPDAA